MRRTLLLVVIAGFTGILCAGCSDAGAPTALDVAEKKWEGTTGAGGAAATLGQLIFDDTRLSVHGNQACRSCHEPSQGFAAALLTANTVGGVVEGSVAGKFGDRKPPSASYVTDAPLFALSGSGAVGGMFWDGRATGAILGNPAADQALGPFLNPVEQAMPDKACVIYRIRTGPYAEAFREVYGTAIDDIAFPSASSMEATCTTPRAAPGEYVALSAAHRAIVDAQYLNVGRAVKEFEATLNKYASRFDNGTMTAAERRGAKLFSGKGKCHTCHSSKGTNPTFTDFAYHNLGVPKHPDNPRFNYSTTEFDKGLGGFTNRSTHQGKFKTPSVRNTGVGNNRTFMHNGVLTSLQQVVDFYSTRDVLRKCTAQEIATLHPSQYGSLPPGNGRPAAGCWPPAEHNANLDTKNMGKLGLTAAEVADMVAFMKALSDP
jgi:cytochrome c peroxidase